MNNKKYDYLIVGAGLYGSVFAHFAKKCGKKVLVIDKRKHIAGTMYTEYVDNIHVHKFGAHIFRTNSKEIWDFVNSFVEFNRFTNSPIAIYKDELYNLPFNMNTFNKMWGVKTPKEAQEKIAEQVKEAGISTPKNLEEQAISMVGKDIYEKLIKGYTAKQWGRLCSELPSFIIKRLPVRMVYDNNYFNDRYQGIPIEGYTKLAEKMLEGIEVKLNSDFYDDREYYENIADKILFTGMIDEYYDYCFGELEYRSLKFEHECLDCENYQGNAVVNYTEYEIPYTRIIEHKHFLFECQNGTNNPKTIITREYPVEWKRGMDAYYPINNGKNTNIYNKYKELADKEDKIIFGGRLGLYKYFDMDTDIREALNLVNKELNIEWKSLK